MRKVFVLFFLALGILSCQLLDSHKDRMIQLLNEYKKDFPQNAAEVLLFKKNAALRFSTELDSWLAVPNFERTFSNTVEKFNAIGETLTDRAIILKSLSIISHNQEIIQEGQKNFFQLVFDIISSFQKNPNLLLAMISYANENLSNSSLGSFQWYEIDEILSSIQSNFLDDRSKKLLDETIQEIESTKKMTPYLYVETDVAENRPDKQISLLSLNTCCLPNYQSLLFGGVRPWQERMEEMGTVIKESKSDILCFQELFDKNAAIALYEQLKEDYKYFYIHIGSKPFGFNPKAFGLGSGLFVASKIPIKDPKYHPFQTQNSYINRGFFSFTLLDKNGKEIHCITTHLDAYDQDDAKKVREKQIEEIVHWINKNNVKNDYPTVVCGDLNVPYRSGENGEKLIQKHFGSPYTKNIQTVTLKNRTYCDYTDFWWNHKKFVIEPKILDYILVYPAKDESSTFLTTKVLSVSNIQKPQNALSDHQGLIATIQLRDFP